VNIKLKIFLLSILLSLSGLSFSAGNQHWDFENTQRWIGDSAEGSISYCSEKSIRWTNPQLGFDINQDSVDDFMMPIGCYQGEAADGAKHNLKVRAAWKMYCSNEEEHYDCTSELFGSEVIEATAVADDIVLGSDGGGNPYIHVTEAPRDLNNDGYPEFWYAVNRDDGRYGYDDTDSEDRELLEKYCGPPEGNSYTWDCTRKSIQTMLISRPDGTYQIVKLPWGAQNTQALLILPNTIGTFDVWGMIYGPHKVARFEKNSFTDVTAEFEQDPLWITVGEDGGPYAKAFEIDESFYIARADIPAGYRPSWAEDVVNSGFMLWKYIPGEGFSVSDVYTPAQDKTFNFKLKQGENTQTRYGAMVKDVPVFDPRWHFFDLEVLDDSKEPVLIVQSEAFTQVGASFKAPHNSNTTYEFGDLYTAQNTDDKIYGGHSAIEGFFIRDGKLIPREREVIAGNGLNGIAFKRFVDINSDGYLDIIVSSGGTPVLPSIYINDGQGTVEKLFLGDVFPNLFDEQYWQVDSHNVHGWGASIYPFYESNKLDLLFWTKGFQNNIPSYAGDDFVFSPGDIVLAKANQDISVLNIFSPAEQHVLIEKCYSSGWVNRNGYQLPCRMGIPFPDETEIDTDGDGIVDSDDALRFNSSESVDTDNDGIGNNTDLDDDGDGVSDNEDAFPLDSSETVDSDSDGTGDNSDVFPNNALYKADSDSDGMPDAWETRYGLNSIDASDATSDQDNDGVSALEEFLAGTIPAGSLDIDGNGQYDALTDGLLLLRGMFLLSGDSLISDAVASDAVYKTSGEVASRIDMLGDLVDIDGNGTVDALTDGLVILRYLFNLRGDVLINDVIAADATVRTAENIEDKIENLMTFSGSAAISEETLRRRAGAAVSAAVTL
jgi:hypothetical protein